MRGVRLAIAIFGIGAALGAPARVGLAAATGLPEAAAAADPGEADVTGTWRGTITLEDGAEALDGGYIVIARAGAEWRVSVGPDERTRYPCTRVTRTDQGIRFEASLPGRDETRLLVYDVRIAGSEMTGTVTFVRHGLTAPAQLAFARADRPVTMATVR